MVFSTTALAAAARLFPPLALCFVLVACSDYIISAPPPYKDALVGLYQAPAESVPEDVPVRVVGPVGFVVSENAELYLEYIKTNLAKRDRQIFGGNRWADADIDPEFLVERAVALFKSRYPDMEMLDDLNAARRAGKKTTIILDVRVAAGKFSGHTTAVDLTALLFDSDLRPVSRVVGRGRAVMPWPATDYRVQQAAAKALQELNAKLNAVLR